MTPARVARRPATAARTASPLPARSADRTTGGGPCATSPRRRAARAQWRTDSPSRAPRPARRARSVAAPVAHVERTRLVVPAIAGQQAVPVVAAEQRPGRDGAQVHAGLREPRAASSTPRASQRMLLVDAAADVHLGQRDRQADSGAPPRTITAPSDVPGCAAHAHRLDVGVRDRGRCRRAGGADSDRAARRESDRWSRSD